MRHLIGLVLLSVLLSQLSFADNEAIPLPTDKPGCLVSAINTSVVKIDDMIKATGLGPLVCQYRSNLGQIKTFRGLAPCLFKNLAEAQKHIQGRQIKAWFTTPQNKTISARIIWNPNDDGWISLSKELFRLYFERPLARLVSKEGRLSFSKSLIGDLEITLSEPLHAQDFVSTESIPSWTKDIEVNYFYLYVKPQKKYQGLIQYVGRFEIKKSAVQNSDGSLIRLSFQTNFNFLNPSRSFDIHAGGEIP